jgi:hypothetical protein
VLGDVKFAFAGAGQEEDGGGKQNGQNILFFHDLFSLSV